MPLVMIRGRNVLVPSLPEPMLPTKVAARNWPLGTVRAVNRQSTGFPAIVVRTQWGQLRAYDARCPHLGADLRHARIVKGCIQCPWHGYMFNRDSGAMVANPNVAAMAPIRNKSATFDPEAWPAFRLTPRAIVICDGWISVP